MKNKVKTIIYTIIGTLFFEFIFLIVLGLIFYYNYRNFTRAKSEIAKNTELKNLKLKKVNININSKKEEQFDNGYTGFIGHINIEKDLKKENNKIKIKNIVEGEIDINKLKIFIILQELNNRNLLDKYIYEYVLNKIKKDNLDPDTFIKRILQFYLLINLIDKQQINNIEEEINKKIIEIINRIQNLIEKKDYKELSRILKNIETMNLKKDCLVDNNKIIQYPFLRYIINKLLSERYYKHIKEVSNELQIDKKLIISAIAVEQLRYLNTVRGYAKTLIKQNKFLINFSKFSYGLGGIKINTFIKINKRLKKYEPKIYNKYFKYYNLQTIGSDGNYDADKIINLLKNHYIATLYTGGLILSIIDKRKKYGIDIRDKPGIILTLYNLGNNKTPHKNPEIGGAIIKVTDNDYKTFGEIGLIIYDYIDFYLDI